jgi:TusA-related sulfurtransferase
VSQPVDVITEHGATEIPATPDSLYDAGHLGCGDGPLLAISQRLKAMSPGAVLEIRSTDPGVVADLPAWCRMVGHDYLGGGGDAYRGRYFVRRKHG